MNFLEELEEKLGAQVAQLLTSRSGFELEKAAGLLPGMDSFAGSGLSSKAGCLASILDAFLKAKK